MYAPMVQQVFELALEGKRHDEIHTTLKELGFIRTSGHDFSENSEDKKLFESSSFIKRILANPTYAGWIVSKKLGIGMGEIKGNWEALVETWKFEQINRH
jgi:hypothetical protein